MLTNLWGKIKIFCLNHDEPVEMVVLSNTEIIKTPFYACKNHNPEDKNVQPCSNRLNMDNYQEIVMQFLEQVEENGLIGDYTNYSFVYKKHQQNITVKVLKWSDKEIHIGILNNNVLGIKKK